MFNTKDQLARFLRCESGATAVEYGLIAALIVVAIVGAANEVADANDENYNLISNAMDSV